MGAAADASNKKWGQLPPFLMYKYLKHFTKYLLYKIVKCFIVYTVIKNFKKT